MLQLVDLPWEDVIFRHIFPLLSTKDLWRLRGVCRDFLCLYTNYMHSCEDLTLHNVNMSNEIFQKMTGDCVSLRRVSLVGCGWLTEASFIPVLRANTAINYVNLTGSTKLQAAAFQVLVVNCKKLHTLLLTDCTWLTRGGWEVLILHQSNLQVLKVSGCWDVDNQVIQKALAKFLKLKDLGLARVEAVTDETLYYIAHSCAHLERLDVSGCWKVTNQGIQLVVEYCPKLKVLVLRDCRGLTEQFLCQLMGKGLKVVSSYSLKQMVGRRKKVNHLGINVQI